MKQDIGSIYQSFIDTSKVTTEAPAGVLYDPWRLRILNPEDFAALRDDGVISLAQRVYLAAFGLLAPTTHNTVAQRFRFVPEEPVIELWVDRQNVLPYSDKEGRQTLVSLGCIVDSIEKAAGVFGFSVECVWDESGLSAVKPFQEGEPAQVCCGRLVFQKGPVTSSNEVLEVMVNRKVVRAEYDERVTLSSEYIASLEQLFRQQFPSLHLNLVHDKLPIMALAKIQEIADRTVIERDTFAMELGNWLLPNEEESRKDGMRGSEFGFDSSFAKRLHDGLNRRIRLLPDEIAAFATGGKIMIKSASAVCIISVTATTPRDYISAGKAYFTLALEFQKHGYMNAMHAAVAEVPIAGRMLAATLRTNALPAVLFRIGKPLRASDGQRAHSARPMLQDVVVS